MMRAKRPILASALATAMMLAGSLPIAAEARTGVTVNERPQEVAMFFDLLIARPTLTAATLVGTGIFAVGLPFSALGGNTDESAEYLIKSPARAAFFRCLGCTQAQHDRLMAEKELEQKRKEQAAPADAVSQAE